MSRLPHFRNAAEADVLGKIFLRYKGQIKLVVAASVFLNGLVFASSFYMLLVYDSVLPSRSGATLAGLFVMIGLVYLFQLLFEVIRSEALLEIANGVHDDFYGVTHRAIIQRSLRSSGDQDDGLQPVRDLDAIHGYLAGAGPVALIDLPWVVIFLCVLAALHLWLGLAALAGVVILAGIALISNHRTQAGLQQMSEITGRRAAATLSEIRMNETAAAMGMQQRLASRTLIWEQEFLSAQSYLARTAARYGGAGRVFRIFLQSIILTVGALLVIDDKASGGVILASSVLAGRALAPVDAAIGNWRGLAAARSGFTRIVQAIAAYRPAPPRSVEMEVPQGDLTLQDVWVAPPGSDKTVLAGVSFKVSPGQSLAIVGPSAAGKSTLVRAILGAWPVHRGEVRIDGALHTQWDQERLGRHIGYVSQAVDLGAGTIAQNIARFDPEMSSDAVIAAARRAGMHEAILVMPQGYETILSPGAPELSAGQKQRIGLARALYLDPFLLVLDEANSNLDATGDAALAQAIMAVRRRNGIVVMVTHRPATLGPVSHIAVLNSGRLVDFGPRNAVLERIEKANGAPPQAKNPDENGAGMATVSLP